MPHVRNWLRNCLNPVFVRNLQFSNSVRGASKFVSLLPQVRASALALPSTGLTLELAAKTVRLEYGQEILNYQSFDITNFDYTLESYFLLAGNILKIDPAQMIANTLNFFIEPAGPKNKFDVFVDQVNRRMKARLPYVESESVAELAAALERQFPGKTGSIIFHTYIQGKNMKETWRHMQQFYAVTRFFREGVEDRIDRMIFPSLKFSFGSSSHICLDSVIQASSPQAIDTGNVFLADHGSAVMNYKKRQLEITLAGKMVRPVNMIFTKAEEYDDKTSKIKLVKPEGSSVKAESLTGLEIIVGEKDVVLTGMNEYGSRYRMLLKHWQ